MSEHRGNETRRASQTSRIGLGCWASIVYMEMRRDALLWVFTVETAVILLIHT